MSLSGWQILGVVVAVIASFFTAIMASLPFFFAHLRVVMANIVLTERKELSTVFISRLEYDERHKALQALLEQGMKISQGNAEMLQSIVGSIPIRKKAS